MSEIRCQFQVPDGVSPTACCADAGTRTAIKSAMVTPATDGVFVSATDGCCASIVKLPGKTDAPHLLPKKAVGKGKPPKRGQPQPSVVLNGRWEYDGKFVEPSDAGGFRFPPIPAVIPDVAGWDGDAVSVTINPKLLAKIVDAIGVQEGTVGGVTLLLKRRTDTDAPDFDQREVASPLVVIGGHGIGVLMPLTHRGLPAQLARVKELAAEFAETFDQPQA